MAGLGLIASLAFFMFIFDPEMIGRRFARIRHEYEQKLAKLKRGEK